MFTVLMICLAAAALSTIACALGKAPAWLPLGLLVVVELLDHLPAK